MHILAQLRTPFSPAPRLHGSWRSDASGSFGRFGMPRGRDSSDDPMDAKVVGLPVEEAQEGGKTPRLQGSRNIENAGRWTKRKQDLAKKGHHGREAEKCPRGSENGWAL